MDLAQFLVALQGPIRNSVHLIGAGIDVYSLPEEDRGGHIIALHDSISGLEKISAHQLQDPDACRDAGLLKWCLEFLLQLAVPSKPFESYAELIAYRLSSQLVKSLVSLIIQSMNVDDQMSCQMVKVTDEALQTTYEHPKLRWLLFHVMSVTYQHNLVSFHVFLIAEMQGMLAESADQAELVPAEGSIRLLNELSHFLSVCIPKEFVESVIYILSMYIETLQKMGDGSPDPTGICQFAIAYTLNILIVPTAVREDLVRAIFEKLSVADFGRLVTLERQLQFSYYRTPHSTHQPLCDAFVDLARTFLKFRIFEDFQLVKIFILLCSSLNAAWNSNEAQLIKEKVSENCCRLGDDILDQLLGLASKLKGFVERNISPPIPLDLSRDFREVCHISLQCKNENIHVQYLSFHAITMLEVLGKFFDESEQVEKVWYFLRALAEASEPSQKAAPLQCLIHLHLSWSSSNSSSYIASLQAVLDQFFENPSYADCLRLLHSEERVPIFDLLRPTLLKSLSAKSLRTVIAQLNSTTSCQPVHFLAAVEILPCREKQAAADAVDLFFSLLEKDDNGGTLILPSTNWEISLQIRLASEIISKIASYGTNWSFMCEMLVVRLFKREKTVEVSVEMEDSEESMPETADSSFLQSTLCKSPTGRKNIAFLFQSCLKHLSKASVSTLAEQINEALETPSPSQSQPTGLAQTQWDMRVAGNFQKYPVLWDLLLMVSHDSVAVGLSGDLVRSVVRYCYGQTRLGGAIKVDEKVLENVNTVLQVIINAFRIEQPVRSVSALLPHMTKNEMREILELVWPLAKTIKVLPAGDSCLTQVVEAEDLRRLERRVRVFAKRKIASVQSLITFL
ncbi:hypothetical protein DFJ73DRAFT_805624 [Zopfochytrium polystomum]|nr:hypothetical protein DFJ73DRAFT_805624 [Zopfochytrium polystomum]